MRKLLWIGSLAMLMALGPGLALAAQGDGCRENALVQLRAAPDGLAIYHRISDRAFFRKWITCDDAQFDLPTAVHESTHFITAETDAFPLIGGGAAPRPHEVTAFYPPSRMARSFKGGELVSTYLRPGTSSSATDFLYLLDELNAYSHGLAAAVSLRRLSRPDEAVDHRDGLAAMMAFVAVYAETAERSEPATWRGLQEPPVARTIATLWGQAETVLASSCGIPNFGAVDKPFIRQICTAQARSALEPILGRAPICATACLADTPDMEADATPRVQPEVETPQPASVSRDSAPSSSVLGDFIARLLGSKD